MDIKHSYQNIQRELNEIRFVLSLCLIHFVPSCDRWPSKMSMTGAVGREAWETIHCECLCCALVFVLCCLVTEK